jgi:hypothetical protein
VSALSRCIGVAAVAAACWPAGPAARAQVPLALAADLGVTFPTLFDATGEFRRAHGVAALPLTLLVDSHGEVSSYTGPALTDDTLATLVTQRLASAS